MSNTLARLAALAAAVMVSAGCANADDSAHRTPASAPVSTTGGTSTAKAEPVTLEALAEHPCRALDDKQLIELFGIPGQTQEGGEQETGFRQCQWETVQGALLFGPHPTVDMTADPRVAQLEPGELDGHRTMLGVDTARDSCMMYVAVADQQSFQVAILPHADQHLGMGGCDIVKQLVTSILTNLGS